MSLLDIARALDSSPELTASFNYDTVTQYVDLVRCLKSTISLQEASFAVGPPESLSVPVHEFLQVSLSISDDAAKLAWAVLRQVAWDFEGTESELSALRQKYIRTFMEHGLARKISEFTLFELL